MNQGFSGGEKKRNEILQMLLLEPRLAVLDETDSGLDVDALKIVAHGVNSLRSPERSMLLVTHYERLLELIVPDRVHVLAGGRIVKSGGKELARELDERGYDWVQAGGTSVSAAIPLTAGVAVPGPEPTRAARLHALADARRGRLADAAPRAMALHGPRAARRGETSTSLPTPLDRDTVAAAQTRCSPMPSLGDASRQLVLLDGERVAGLGATALAGVEVTSLEARWDEFVAAFAKPIGAAEYPLAALNTAFARHGLWIRVPAGAVVRAPIHLVLIGSARARIAAQPRIVIEAEPGAQATFVQHFIDCGSESRGWSNSVTQLKQAAGSRLGFYRLQRHARGVAHTSLLSAELGESAELTAGYFDLGGRLVRNDIAIALRGAGARTDLFGLLLAGTDQHVDDHTRHPPRRRRDGQQRELPRHHRRARPRRLQRQSRRRARLPAHRRAAEQRQSAARRARGDRHQARARDLCQRRQVQPRLDRRRARRRATVLPARARALARPTRGAC